MPSLGLSLGLRGVRVLGAAGPTYDPDALAWFEAVEATGATFGPDSATANANKMAWSDWVVAQKNAESPIAGRTNWQQLTQEDEGFIQPLMGVSTFNIPALFGGRTFTGFVDGYYLPALGLKGGVGKSLTANRDWDVTPLNDMSAGMWVTGLGGSTVNRIFGTSRSTVSTIFLEDARVRMRSTTLTTSGSNFAEGSVPRSAFVSRHSAQEYQVHNGSLFTVAVPSVGAVNEVVSFFNGESLELPATIRGGLAFYGRSINLEAMNTACAALSEAITWPT